MRETADLARTLGVRMHTHLAETREEDAYCRQALGRTPAEYAEDMGWLGPDVWLASRTTRSPTAPAATRSRP
jgi:cytosine/adenosine deaminase-related metal-dependent hydrolase